MTNVHGSGLTRPCFLLPCLSSQPRTLQILTVAVQMWVNIRMHMWDVCRQINTRIIAYRFNCMRQQADLQSAEICISHHKSTVYLLYLVVNMVVSVSYIASWILLAYLRRFNTSNLVPLRPSQSALDKDLGKPRNAAERSAHSHHKSGVVLIHSLLYIYI